MWKILKKSSSRRLLLNMWGNDKWRLFSGSCSFFSACVANWSKGNAHSFWIYRKVLWFAMNGRGSIFHFRKWGKEKKKEKKQFASSCLCHPNVVAVGVKGQNCFLFFFYFLAGNKGRGWPKARGRVTGGGRNVWKGGSGVD